MEREFSLNWPLFVEEAKQRRKKRKLTQQRLALLAGVSTPTVSRFENDEKDIQLSSVLNILGVLGMIAKQRLDFPKPNPVYLFDRDVVRFYGEDHEKRITCEITGEALDDHFEGNGKDKLKVFNAHLDTILHQARRQYFFQGTNKDDVILICSENL